MRTAVRFRRFVVFGLVLLGLACGDASTAPRGDQTFLVSVAGLGTDDAGITLRLIGTVDLVTAARPSLDVAWAHDNASVATVAVVGPLSETSDVLIVRGLANKGPLRVELLEVATADGVVSLPSSPRARVRLQQHQ